MSFLGQRRGDEVRARVRVRIRMRIRMSVRGRTSVRVRGSEESGRVRILELSPTTNK